MNNHPKKLRVKGTNISLSFLSEQMPRVFAWQFERVDDPKKLRVKGEISFSLWLTKLIGMGQLAFERAGDPEKLRVKGEISFVYGFDKVDRYGSTGI